MQLSIIIVNYRTPGLVLDCLRTVYENTRDVEFEVLVADNGSGDDSRALITGTFAGIRWIEMAYNAGFARANNEAIRQSRGEIVLLLNSDTLMEDNAIGRCYGRLAASGYVAAGIQLLNKDRTPQISGLFNMPGGISHLLLLPALGKVFSATGKLFGVRKPHLEDSSSGTEAGKPSLREEDKSSLTEEESPSLTEVDWVNGAFLMVKRTAIERAGLMDEDFFLYAEEAEWCGRLQQQGKLCLFGDIRAIHLEGVTVNKESGSSTRKDHNLYDRKGLQVMVSGFVRIRKQYGVFWLLSILAVYLAEIPVFFLCALVAALLPARNKKFTFRHLAGYIRNVFVLLGLMPRILRNKPWFYKVLISLFFCLSLLHYPSFSQEYSYTHYDISDGLAGSTVYGMTQDKEGFIWVGTETGVSRFDGTHFQNFTTKEGLPDPEVLNLFCDSEDRIWMAPFSKSICFYYKGKIHNPENDPVLGRIKLRGNIEHFAEDKEGNILIGERTALHFLSRDGSLKEYDSIDGRPISASLTISDNLSGHFLVQEQNDVYELSDERFRKLFSFPFPDHASTFITLTKWIVAWRKPFPISTCIRSMLTGKTLVLKYALGHVSYTGIGDSLLYMNKSDGSYEYNFRTGLTRRYLPGVEVSYVFRDDEGNTWFTTLGQGIYRLNSEEFRNVDLHAGGIEKFGVHAIRKTGNDLFVGSDHFLAFHFRLPTFTMDVHALMGEQSARIMTVDVSGNGNMIYGSDFTILSYTRDFRFRKMLQIGVKASFRKNEKQILFASSEGAFLVDMTSLKVIDTIFRQRTTSLYSRNEGIYMGTLDGLYLLKKDGSVFYLGKDIPFLRKRITAIVASKDSTLWIASYDGGLIGYRDGRVVAAITSAEGLTSNICRALELENDHLWVGTDKGLNRIDLGTPGYRITHYTYNDGLGSDMINTVVADGSVIYVGTPAGLTYFDQTRVDTRSGCRLVLLGAIHSGRKLEEGVRDFSLPYSDNNIRFEYVGISYKSAGNILYRYRLIGLDSNWKTTKETFLEYPTLSPGNYQLQVLAINKFGMQSKPLYMLFSIPTPFWRTAWFNMLLVMILLGLTFLYFSFRIRRIRKRQHEKDKLGKKIAEVEHKALQAQMNPHFIFNCLNSIQQLVFDQDIFAANKYVTGLARLIRATLYNSTQTSITLADEIEYLSGYLELERLRFRDKMDYSITVDPSLDQREIMIPPMLIQPYIENSMRHGLRHKTDGKGRIRLDIRQSEGKMVFLIEDNGIGRDRAAHFKTTEHIEYQSKGMSLTADRIRLINSVYGEDINLRIIDMKDENQQASGTQVILEFPKFDQTI
jgi:GT2 family glycosyltransferase/ligand-binding sensor domain-containing protein/two-component sensor histidine kinase